MTEEIKKFESIDDIKKQSYVYTMGDLHNASLLEVITYLLKNNKNSDIKEGESEYIPTDEEILEYANYLLENKLLSI